jgi:phosphatidate cytidylyltransferase
VIAPPSSTLLWMLGATLVVLALGSVVRLVALRNSEAELRRKRLASLRTWWCIALVVGGCLLAGRLGVCVLMAVASILGLREYVALLGIRDAERPTVYSAYGIAVINYGLILFGQASVFLVFVPVGGLAILAVVQLLQGKAAGYIRTTGGLFWGIVVLIYGLSHAAYLFILPASLKGSAGPAGWFLFLLILTEFNDIFQAIIGRAMGAHKQHRITPTVSPNKTWEGFLGGMLVTIGLALLLAPWLTTLGENRGPLALPEWVQGWAGAVLAGIVVAVAGFFGDINMSAIKRDSGVKDSSAMLPGMGGLIDRVDSLTFTGPALVYFLIWWMK